MGTIADKLAHLNQTKTAIKDALLAKGVAIEDSDTFRSYAEKIGEISVNDIPDWKPNPNWWDIEKIIDEDTRDYKGKVGVIMYNFNNVSDFQLSSSGMTAVATSDGAFYSYADNGTNVSHNWDTSKDKEDGKGFKTRWVIYYYTTDTTNDTFQQSHAKFGWAYNYIAYLVLRINCTYSVSFCAYQRHLEGISNVGYVVGGTNFNYFCQNCVSIQKLPDNLDVSEGLYFTNFCPYCISLKKLPDNFNPSKGINFNSFCTDCYSLLRLPDNLDMSSAIELSSFCRNCYSLQKLSKNLDISSGTNFTNFCYSCTSLKELADNLNVSSGTNFSYFCNSCYSLQKLPDNFNTSKGINFSYFCNNCYSLLSLPENLDVSSGTNFNAFCQNCYALESLPENLDVSSGTNFNSFCRNNNSLRKSPKNLDTSKGTDFAGFFTLCDFIYEVPQISMVANTVNINAQGNSPFGNSSWLTTINLILPSSSNIWLNKSNRISIESFRYIADNAPDVNATPRTLTIGSTNIARCNEADSTIITDLQAKGWTIA